MTKQEKRNALLMRRPSALRFVGLALLAPVFLLILSLWVQDEFDQAERLRLSVVESFDHRLALVQLLSNLKDAETAQRGYLLTGDRAFLAPYAPARRRIAALHGAAANGSSTAVRQQIDRRIAALVDTKFAEMDRTIAVRATSGTSAAIALVREGQGKRVMDELRRQIGLQIAIGERQSIDGRRRYVEQRLDSQRIAAIVAAIAILIVTMLLYSSWRLRRERYAALVDAFEAAERNQTILDSTVDAMLILNPSGTVEAINAAATDMLGFATEELERRDISTVVDLAPGEGSFHQRVGLIDGQLKRTFLADREARHSDGHVIPVDVAMGVMVVPSGDHLVVSLRDISERKRLEQLKDDLMSTVSHELRTPLTSIVGSLGLLRAGSAGPLPPDASRLVAIAENNSRRLIRLINDMLDIDRIESGKLEMHREPIDLRTVVAQAAQGSEGLAAAKSVTIRLDDAPEPVIVSADADRLLQVITNLLSNAIRYSPSGSAVTLALTIDDGTTTVTVDDCGPGVPPAFRSRVFGRFEQARDGAVEGGAGLGLAISREIVLQHGGRIWFEDAPTGGARFAFALDRMRPARMDDAGAARVLICVPDDDAAGALIALVVNEGCAYDLATDTAQANAAIAATRFDALLIDLALPQDGGIAFARAARDGPPPLDVPMILIATNPRAEDEISATLEVVDWIQTPDEIGKLTTSLRRAIAQSGRDRPTVLHLDDDTDLLQVVAASLEPEARVLSVTDLASAQELLKTVTPDAAILDLRLAQGSGLDLLPDLLDGKAVPTIIYSAQDVAGDVASRVDAVLVKARGSLPDLKATLRRVIHGRSQGRER